MSFTKYLYCKIKCNPKCKMMYGSDRDGPGWLTGYTNHSRHLVHMLLTIVSQWKQARKTGSVRHPSALELHSYRVPRNLHYLTIILFSKQYWEGLTGLWILTFESNHIKECASLSRPITDLKGDQIVTDSGFKLWKKFFFFGGGNCTTTWHEFVRPVQGTSF